MNFYTNRLNHSPSRRYPSFHSANDAILWTINECSKGAMASPRGMRTFEQLGVSFVIENPRARLVTIPGRKWSLPLAIGELCWHLRGSDQLSGLTHYARVWRHFSDDGVSVRGSCYGKKVFNSDNGDSQWDHARRYLESDPYTRRAVLSIGGYDVNSPIDTADVACAQSLQFLIRDGRLHLYVHMRSNDAFLGLPYDIFLFTILQEIMSVQIGIPLGEYVHMANSMHIYERDLDKIDKMYAGPFASGEQQQITNLDDLEILKELEILLQLDQNRDVQLPNSSPWREMAEVILTYNRQKSN